MELTQEMIREYIEITNAINIMSERLKEIKNVIKACGKDVIKVGPYTVKIHQYTQTRPVAIDRIKDILQEKAALILQDVNATRINVTKKGK